MGTSSFRILRDFGPNGQTPIATKLCLEQGFGLSPEQHFLRRPRYSILGATPRAFLLQSHGEFVKTASFFTAGRSKF